MVQNTKSEILSYCKKKTIEVDIKNINDFSANVLSADLNISRSLASQYLNSFVKEGILIKIATRPVGFLYKKAIEDQFQVVLKENIFLSIEEFWDTISKESSVKKNFRKIIGHESSLNKVIEQIKAALSYPNNGLPIILFGEKGVGKALLCKEMYEYAVESNIIQKDSKLCRVKISIESEDIIDQLLGIDNKKGILEICNGGIVFIQNAQNLKPREQQRLAKIIEERRFKRVNSNKNISLNVRIVLSIDENYNKKISEDLIQLFPVICHIPKFRERFVDEKIELVVHLFKMQGLNLGKNLYVSNTVIKMLIMRDYDRNIDELKNIIEDLCARANISTKHEELYIKVLQLPECILKDYTENIFTDQVEYIDITAYKKVNEAEKLLDVFDEVIESLMLSQYLTDSAIADAMGILTKYYNFLAHDNGYIREESKEIESRIDYILNKVLLSYNVTIPMNYSILLSYYIYLVSESDHKVINWNNDKSKANYLKSCLKQLEKYNPKSKFVAEKIRLAIQNNLEVEFDDINKIILLINLIYFNASLNKGKYLCIIIAHGKSTATSMAETANRLMGTHIYEAFDMPLDTSMIDVADRLKSFIDRYSIKDDILLLVDMGSLERVDEYLKFVTNQNIGVINNVSTKMALDIGNMVINNEEMKFILKRATDNAIVKYTLVENKVLKDLVIFISDNGIKMANRMKELFINNLPKVIDLDVISLEQHDLLKEMYIEDLEKEYKILFISGTCSNANMLENFILLEDIIFNIDIIRKHLSKYLTVEELDIFSQNLIYSFSLENVVDSLSILDAKKLLGFVKEAVAQIQAKLNKRFYGNTIIGLYIHICCMIERLVTKEPINNGSNLEFFKEENKFFIESINQSFYKICKHYGVDIPISEISYLYDYIK